MTFRCHTANIAARFVECATLNPGATAIVDQHGRLTYGEVLTHARAVTFDLIRQKAGADHVAAIVAERGRHVPLGMIACLLANIPFVVIDPAYPVERATVLIALAKATLILSCEEDGLWGSPGFRALCPSIPRVALDVDSGTRIDAATEAPGPVAYLLFTSGTTGSPRGIRTGHAPLIHFIGWYADTFAPSHGSHFSMLSGLSHDPILRDVFVPLSTGGALYIPRQADILSPDRLFDWMRACEIGYSHLTPQLIDVLAARKKPEGYLDRLTHVFSGGDILRPATVQRIRALAPNAQLVNFYGTSETPQAMAYHVVGDEPPPYPIGRPISDVKLHVWDHAQCALPSGRTGEIVVETDFLSEGYIDGATRAAFARTPDGARLYRTGDLGRFDDQGLLFFTGRLDDQVKIRGYRVDCAEIAGVIEERGFAEAAVVVPEQAADGQTFLAAFVAPSDAGVQDRLSAVLPGYMVPELVVGVERFPLLANGKVDRQALRKLAAATLQSKADEQSVEDDTFLEGLAKIIGPARFDRRKSFLDMGGDSLSFISVSLFIEERLGKLPDRWEYTPVEDIARTNLAAPGVKGAAPFWALRDVEVGVLLRAVAIILVLADHAQIALGPGRPYFLVTGTSTLFVLSGFSLARFLFPAVIETGNVGNLIAFVAKYAVPASLWQLVRTIKHPPIWIPDLLLLGTMWASPYKTVKRAPFWFLDILTAGIVLFTVLVLACRQALKSGKTISLYGFYFSVTMLGIGALFVQQGLGVWDGQIGGSGVGPFRWFWLIPLGATIHAARSFTDKALAAALITALFAVYGTQITGAGYENSYRSFLFLSVLLLIYVKKIRLPRLLHVPVVVLASNSLMIYLFGVWFLMEVLLKTSLGGHKFVCIVLSAALGVFASVVWNRLSGGIAAFVAPLWTKAATGLFSRNEARLPA